MDLSVKKTHEYDKYDAEGGGLKIRRSASMKIGLSIRRHVSATSMERKADRR